MQHATVHTMHRAALESGVALRAAACIPARMNEARARGASRRRPRGATDGLGHLAGGAVLELLRLVEVRRDLHEPLRLDRDAHPHELLRREGELVEQDPARPVLVLEERQARVDVHRVRLTVA